MVATIVVWSLDCSWNFSNISFIFMLHKTFLAIWFNSTSYESDSWAITNSRDFNQIGKRSILHNVSNRCKIKLHRRVKQTRLSAVCLCPFNSASQCPENWNFPCVETHFHYKIRCSWIFLPFLILWSWKGFILRVWLVRPIRFWKPALEIFCNSDWDQQAIWKKKL